MMWERRSQCAQWHTGVALRLGSRIGNCGWRWGSTQPLHLQGLGTFLCSTIRGLQAPASHHIRLNHLRPNNVNSWEVFRNQHKPDYNQGLEHPINRQICKYFFFLAEMLWMAAHLLSKMLPFLSSFYSVGRMSHFFLQHSLNLLYQRSYEPGKAGAREGQPEDFPLLSIYKGT